MKHRIFRSLAILLLGSIQPAYASSSVVTIDGKGIRGEEISYRVDDVAMRGYLAYDSGVKGLRPGVIVVHEWWGHNDYVRHRARKLAQMGYTAFALDMYGGGKKADHPDDAQKFMMEVIGNMDAAVARFEAARKLLEAHPTTNPDKTAAIGYCFGGATVLHMARAGIELAGVASFHGNLSTRSPAESGAIKCPILVLHGAADPLIPQEQVDAFKKEMKDAGAEMEFIAYPDAVHAFTNPGATELGAKFALPLAYHPEADAKSWKRLSEFLKGIFNDD